MKGQDKGFDSAYYQKKRQKKKPKEKAVFKYIQNQEITNQNFSSKKQIKSIFSKEILSTYLQKNYILMALLIKTEYFPILQLMQMPQLTKLQKQHGMNQILKQK